MSKMTLIGLLVASVIATVPAPSQQDFQPVPKGSVVLTPAGDTLTVPWPARLVSDSAIVRLDEDLQDAHASLEDRAEQVRVLQEALDSLEVALAAEKAWRSVTTEILRDQDHSGWTETLENFGLVVGGFAVCRITEPR